MMAFDALWTNKLGLQDQFVNYWFHTSRALGQNPYVVGFDPLNEPFPGMVLQKPKLNLSGHFDKNQLTPVYERVFEVYQANNEDSIMWFEPGQYPDEIGILGGIVRPVGFEKPPGGEIGSNKHVLNDHTYCC